MNKTEKRKLTIKLICEMIEKDFPDYEIDDHGEGGRMTFSPDWGDMDDGIEFSRSDYSLCTFNWASLKTKQNEVLMEEKINVIIKQVNEL